MIAVVGGGIGGLSAALALARAGRDVTLFEARHTVGGLASGFDLDGERYDAGPYVLLDRPGLEWALEALAVPLGDLDPVESVYSVDGVVTIHRDLVRTASALDARWPGSGTRYGRFVERMAAARERLAPMLYADRPGPLALLRTGAFTEAGFLLRSLGAVLDAQGFPPELSRALSIWTHIAAQDVHAAPSPMAFVPALIHTAGAWIPRGGIGAVASWIEREARRAGVTIRCATPIARVVERDRRVVAVETRGGERVVVDAVVSDCGLSTYTRLVDPGDSVRATLGRLSLQSPGACAYVRVKGRMPSTYLHFSLDPSCRLFVRPREGASAGMIIVPIEHQRAERMSEKEQQAFLERVVEGPWWREGVDDYEILATRTPRSWGRDFSLYRDSMNPVMTARFMRRGRLSHRSPWFRGLYLAGSATHPGQWVSFCAISGVLAARAVLEDRP